MIAERANTTTVNQSNAPGTVPGLLNDLRGQVRRHRRLHETRGDGVDADPEAPELARRGLGQRDQPGLRPAPYLASRGLKWVQHYDEPGLSDEDLEAIRDNAARYADLAQEYQGES